MRTRSGLEQKINYLPSGWHLLTWWLPSPTKIFQEEEVQEEEPEFKEPERAEEKVQENWQMFQLLRPVKHQRRKKREEALHINQDNNFIAMLFQVTTPSNNSDWWLDTGATCHIFSNKDLISTYVAAKDNVSVADCSTAAVLGTETVVLTLTSEKTLKSVKHIP